ncbi:MAG: DUF4288 domain-containing protein [Anaerolineales bacterium]
MWYIATLMVRCTVGAQQTGPWTVEEQIRLVEAEDEDIAYDKALEFGRRQAQSYENDQGATVKWECIGLEDLEWMVDERIQDGAQVRARFLKRDDPTALITPKNELVVFKSRRPGNGQEG